MTDRMNKHYSLPVFRATYIHMFIHGSWEERFHTLTGWQLNKPTKCHKKPQRYKYSHWGRTPLYSYLSAETHTHRNTYRRVVCEYSQESTYPTDKRVGATTCICIFPHLGTGTGTTAWFVMYIFIFSEYSHINIFTNINRRKKCPFHSFFTQKMVKQCLTMSGSIKESVFK